MHYTVYICPMPTANSKTEHCTTCKLTGRESKAAAIGYYTTSVALVIADAFRGAVTKWTNWWA